MITLHLPPDRELLAAFGEVALRHEHLNHILRMTIKTLADLRPDEALDATAYDGSRQLRKRIRKLARQRLGEGAPLLKLQAVLERCRLVTDKRYPLPTLHDLKRLSCDIQSLTTELNLARLQGFLSKALVQRDKNRRGDASNV